MMDKIEDGILAAIPPSALTLTLTRSAIKMQHGRSWGVDKTNSSHDLMICLSGRGAYVIDGIPEEMRPGDAMLIPRGHRFQGHNPGPDEYTGVAQHFTLSIYGQHDLLQQMNLRPHVRLSRWHLLEPVIRHYRDSAPPSSVTLSQHHLFMVLLIAFIEDSFIGWRKDASWQPDTADAMEIAVMKAVTTISAAPTLPDIAATAVSDAPYNSDYFLREFQKRVGKTPRKYQEAKRMELAMRHLEEGQPVGETARLVGYSDPYYFSRMFRRTLGLSPRDHIARVEKSRNGGLMSLDEPEQEAVLRDPRQTGGRR